MKHTLPLRTVLLLAPLAALQAVDAANDRQLVSQADFVYATPVPRPVEGQPIGNGRMGTLVWTSPGAVHFQINRNDVFAVNRNHAGGQFGPTDICGGCAGVAVDVGGSPFAAGPAFRQRLSLYDAEASGRCVGRRTLFRRLASGRARCGD